MSSEDPRLSADSDAGAVTRTVETQWAVRCDKTGRIDMYGTTATGRYLAEQEVARREHNSKLAATKLPTGTLVSRIVSRTYSATEWCVTSPGKTHG